MHDLLTRIGARPGRVVGLAAAALTLLVAYGVLSMPASLAILGLITAAVLLLWPQSEALDELAAETDEAEASDDEDATDGDAA